MKDGRRLLIVEDEYLVLEELRQSVISFGYEHVAIASEARVAMEKFEEFKPDLVLLDITLERHSANNAADGIAVARWIRERAQTPIIFVTAMTDTETLARAKPLQPAGFVTKPLNEMQLRTTIALALIGTPPNSTTEEKRDRVFISYSHRDKRFLEMLEEHLKPLRRKGIDIWSDTRIHPGSEWRLEIETQLRRCRIAVMLVSASFLASDFIANNELPPLLEAAKREGATILYVVVRPCKIPIELSKYQALHSFAKSLSELSNAERDRIWMALSDWIEAII